MRFYTKAVLSMVGSWVVNPFVFFSIRTPFPLLTIAIILGRLTLSIYLGFKALSLARTSGKANEQ